jgi:Sec-independent protein secretion pathway component TatC
MVARQGVTLVTAICAFIGTLVIIQLWLVAASLEALYSDETQVLIPATVASAVLFVINGVLLLHVRNFDRKMRPAPRED